MCTFPSIDLWKELGATRETANFRSSGMATDAIPILTFSAILLALTHLRTFCRPQIGGSISEVDLYRVPNLVTSLVFRHLAPEKLEL